VRTEAGRLAVGQKGGVESICAGSVKAAEETVGFESPGFQERRP